MAGTTKKKASFGTSMGVSSIIAILVILLLVVFSTLSIITSKADLVMSQKSSSSIQAYYVADAAAEEMLSEVAVAVAVAALDATDWRPRLPQDVYTFTSVDGGTLISYSVPIDDNRNLNVELLADDNGGVTRELWQVVPAGEWNPDRDLNVFIPSLD